MTILGHFLALLGHFWCCMGHFKPIYPLLIHCASRQTSLGTSLEYPRHMHISIYENWPFWAIFGLIGPFLMLYGPFLANLPLVDSLCILSDISWDKFRVPTTHTFEKNTTNLGIFENRGFWTILGDCGCKWLKTILKIDTGHISTISMLIMQKK